ncbi:MAG: DUF1800 domain-containing protein [Acidobacteria bacterium]|jgi:uncharacterized protein (DUF1800 family)|nr:DUF1800 domain-containing protein [Acidobacteriota bacterium]
MNNRKSRWVWQILSANFLLFLLVFPILAQPDPNPDSPTPILISEPNSTRALALPDSKFLRGNVSRIESRAFLPDSKVVLYVTNLDLLADEGASAFRIYVEDAKGRKYRFPVLDIQPLKGQEWIYALTVRLKDELGFWEEPLADGDVLIGITWRGLASNRVRLGFGKTGGDIKDDAGAVPTPAPTSPIKKSINVEPNYVGYLYSGDRTRFMEQATFGPTSELDTRIRRVGLRTWLAEQFEAPYPTNPYPNLALMPINIDPNTCDAICRRDFYSMYPVQNWFFKEAFYGEAQLKHRVAWALSELWVISGVDTQQASWMIAYHQLLSKNAFGSYRDLMYDMTLNPGMGNYLDMVRSTRNNPNENYAREILQLFSIGLFMLNQDGTLQLDGSGKPIPTYDQNTVNNFTKVFTGWTFCNQACQNSAPGLVNYKDPLILNQNNHDVTAKTLLSYPGAVNQTIAAGQNGATELNQALDNIFYHPNVAPFVSRILIQQMVTSDPTPAFVGRVASVFNNNGSNVRGDMKAVVKAILLDPEARGNIKTDPNYGKLREPVQLATNVLRQFDVQSASGGAQSDGYINQIVAPMGQNAFNSPTVFNYYTPDYVIPGTALNGPEFGILTTGTTIARANFMNTMVFSRVPVSSFAPLGTSINLSEMQTLAAADTTGNRLVDTLNTRMMHGAMSAQMKSTILTAVQAVASTNTLLRAQTAIYLVATSSQYQVQR